MADETVDRTFPAGQFPTLDRRSLFARGVSIRLKNLTAPVT